MATKAVGPGTTSTAFAPWEWLSDRLNGPSHLRLPDSRFLGDSLAVFDASIVRTAPDGYPSVDGMIGGRSLKLSFIPDTLALKRLPQLWLSVTLRSEHLYPPVVLTARPRGDEYVSLRSGIAAQHAVPDWLPRDFEVRGSSDAQALLDRLRGPLSAVFGDQNVKEVALTRHRLHLLYRLSQGRRGMHLLLRRPVFDDVLTEQRLRSLLAYLLMLEGPGCR